ncbi:hypothetical protein UlMin_042937 [Ulmus minor]
MIQFLLEVSISLFVFSLHKLHNLLKCYIDIYVNLIPFEGRRYYEFIDDFRSLCGPIFLVIFVEGPCNGIKVWSSSGIVRASLLWKKSSFENLRYLSSKQALFDLSIFCQYFQDSFSVKLNGTNVENPWFFFGVSYPETLSAWFRLKLCHLTCEILASSAVVLVQETTELFEQSLATDGKAVKALFGAAKLEIDGDSFYFLADAAAIGFNFAVPIGNLGTVCSSLVEAKKNGDDLVEHLKNTTLTRVNSHSLWWFQLCTEVAYFQVAPSNDSIRSSKVDTSVWFDALYESLVVALCGKYHLDLCKNVLGEGVYPNVTATNIYYGGRKFIFTSGSQNPWPHALKQTSAPDYFRLGLCIGTGFRLARCGLSYIVLRNALISAQPTDQPTLRYTQPHGPESSYELGHILRHGSHPTGRVDSWVGASC